VNGEGKVKEEAKKERGRERDRRMWKLAGAA